MSKLCVDKLCVSKLCVRQATGGRAEGRRKQAEDAADAADVEIDASPTDLTLTLEAAECNEQHEEEVISDAGKWDAASLIPDLMW